MDISIKHLKSYVFEPKTESLRKTRAQEIVSTKLTVTEKVDGTKLTLVRTDKYDTNDYTNNWIVSYKGTVLYAREFSHYGDKERGDIQKNSTGIGQYIQVFDHLKKINGNIKSIPTNTEFSVEFAQNKETLTRTYESFGAMFLRSFASVKYRIISGNLHTQTTSAEITDVEHLRNMATKLGLKTFPIYFIGKLNRSDISRSKLLSPSMVDTNWSDPVDVIKKFSSAVLTIPSVLGGKIEGVVIEMENGKFFKVVQSDQYDADVRAAKKDQYRDSPGETTEYFKQLRKIISDILTKIDTTTGESEVLGVANRELSKIPISQFPKNSKKTETQIRDDAHETLRLIVGKGRTLGSSSKSIGLVPIAGKPLHIGHWKLIEKASNENDRVVVYTSDKDRSEKGEFPIKGSDFVYFWHDFFIPILPDNVVVKFVDSPVRSVMHEIGWFEQSATQDAKPIPTINLYSDASDVLTNFKDADLSKYPTIFSSGKLKRVGVERSSTVNISGTKMREFLQSGDKESFIKNLPPVSPAEKIEIWNTLLKNKPKDQMAEFVNELVASVIMKMDSDFLREGGWRTKDTMATGITPSIVAKVIPIFDRFISEFNSFSGLPPIKSNGPVGSGTYYTDDLKDNPDNIYGDIDIQVVLPIDSSDRAAQLESDKLYHDKILEFIKTKTPKYIFPVEDDKDFGREYLIFIVDNKNIQVDLVVSYKHTADWVKVRTTPERGLKGFVTGMVLSALSKALNVQLSTTTTPYFNTLDGKPVGVLVKKNTKSHQLNPDTVFLDIVKYYGKLAGVNEIDSSALNGHFGLDKTDPSLIKKLRLVLALANSLNDNGVFSRGVVVSKDNITFNSRRQFIGYVLDTYVKMMNDAMTAKKLDKADTPEALATIEKIKAHAGKGIEMAKKILGNQS